MGWGNMKLKVQPMFRITGTGLGCFVIFLTSFAFVFCVVWSLIFDFKRSTKTHCKTQNFLPTISAATAGFTPQRYIWRICIALQSTPRIMVALGYRHFYQSYTVDNQRQYKVVTNVNSCLHVLENLCLVGLTYISSDDNFKLHKISFIGFIVFSQLHMVVTLILYNWAHSWCSWSEQDLKSYRWKKILAAINISGFLLGAYFYWRHVTYCDAGANSLFAAMEYLTIASNIGFHSTFFCYDISRHTLVFLPPRTMLESDDPTDISTVNYKRNV